MFDLRHGLGLSCNRISPGPVLGQGFLAASGSTLTTTMTITMTTSGTRGQVGVD